MSHPQDPPSYTPGDYQPTSAYPTITQVAASSERASWPLLLIVGALSVALAMVIARFALNDDTSAALNPGATSPSTPGAQKHHKPNANKPGGDHAMLPHTRLASGPRWTMQVPRKWNAVDIPNLDEQAAWKTPGGFPGRGDAVSVIHDSSLTSLNLHQYVQYQRNLLGVGISTASDVRTQVSHGRGELTYHLLVNGYQAQTLQVVVRTANGLASASFVAPASTFGHDVKRAHRYLATLAGR